ncbi:MAG: glycosyltransferase family 2 protein [Lysobacter sp.]
MSTWPFWGALFWLCIALVMYAYAGYPLLVALLARTRGSRPRLGGECPAITVVIAAHDEERTIGARVRNLLAQDYPATRLKVLVVSDGSGDRTAEEADIGDPRVTVIELPGNVGKAMAINAALARVDTGLVAFADARQQFAPDALRHLVAPFADPKVGLVSGELVIRPAEGDPAGHGVGLYWRMEKVLRAHEARIGWLHGATGAIHAMRRELFRPLPAGTVLDDMWMPLQVLLSGRRVWMARDAIAIDVGSRDNSEEFSRKLRTLAGNWQLLALLPVLLDPRRNPVFFAWFSHKFLRLLVPWALLLALLASAAAAATSRMYLTLVVLQVLAYLGAGIALVLPRLAARVPLLPTAGSFVVLNFAALLSLPAMLVSDPARLWKKH